MPLEAVALEEVFAAFARSREENLGGTVNMVQGSGAGSSRGGREQPRQTEHIGEKGNTVPWGWQPLGDPIKDYDIREDEEEVDGTQNSTARMTFFKVSSGLPVYLDFSKNK